MIYYLSCFIVMWLFLEFAVVLTGGNKETPAWIMWLGKLTISSCSAVVFYATVQTLTCILKLLEEYNIV